MSILINPYSLAASGQLSDHDSALIVKCLMNEGGTGNAVNAGSGGDIYAYNSPADVAGVVSRGRQCLIGSNQYFSRVNADVRPGNNSFSFAFWYKPQTGNITVGEYLLSLWGAANGDRTFTVFRETDETITFSVWYNASDGNVAHSSTATVADTNWHCVVGIYNQSDTSITLHVDGTKSTVVNANLSSLNVGSGNFMINDRSGGTAKGDGAFDVVCIWDNAVLGDAEANEFYNSGSGVESW